MPGEDILFGEVAVEMRLLTHGQLVDCLMLQQEEELAGKPSRRIGEIAISKGILTERTLQAVLDRQAEILGQRSAAPPPPPARPEEPAPPTPPARATRPSMEVLLSDFVVEQRRATSGQTRRRPSTGGGISPARRSASDSVSALLSGYVDDPHDVPPPAGTAKAAGAGTTAREIGDSDASVASADESGVASASSAADASDVASLGFDGDESTFSGKRSRVAGPRAPAPASPVEARDDGPVERLELVASQTARQLAADLLRQAVERGAADLHVHSGAAPLLRKDGELQAMVGHGEPVDPDLAEQVVRAVTDDAQWGDFVRAGEVDFAYALGAAGRARVNAYRQQRGVDIVFRLIPATVPTLETLNLPQELTRLMDYRTGLVLCTGPASCGKSTTLAALLGQMIESRAKHVITIEDPIELLYPQQTAKAQVNQRQLAAHTQSCERALRAALREDPDVIAISELRDRETVGLAMTAAETGHLVLGTLHTSSAVGTINRIIYAFPAQQQSQVRAMLAESLRAVVAQRLVRHVDGTRRLPALEVLMVTPAVANLIRDEKIHQVPSAMQVGQAHGMRLLDDSLQKLVEAGLVAPTEAKRHANNPARF